MRDLMQRPENADFIGDAWSTYPLEREQRKGARRSPARSTISRPM
jgi:hypothetical protein